MNTRRSTRQDSRATEELKSTKIDLKNRKLTETNPKHEIYSEDCEKSEVEDDALQEKGAKVHDKKLKNKKRQKKLTQAIVKEQKRQKDQSGQKSEKPLENEKFAAKLKVAKRTEVPVALATPENDLFVAKDEQKYDRKKDDLSEMDIESAKDQVTVRDVIEDKQKQNFQTGIENKLQTFSNISTLDIESNAKNKLKRSTTPNKILDFKGTKLKPPARKDDPDYPVYCILKTCQIENAKYYLIMWDDPYGFQDVSWEHEANVPIDVVENNEEDLAEIMLEKYEEWCVANPRKSLLKGGILPNVDRRRLNSTISKDFTLEY